MDWLNTLAGFGVGLAVGLTGVGGGSLMSPLLILFLGVAPTTAIGTDLWFATITKSIGGYVHHRHAAVDFAILRLLATGSIPAALLTGLWLYTSGFGHSGGPVLSKGLGLILLLTSLATLYRRRIALWAHSLPVRDHPKFPFVKAAATISAGALLGIMVTLTSVGAGALGATMLLTLYPRRLSLHKLVGTDILHAVPIAFIGGLIHLIVGSVDFNLLVFLLLGSVPGIVVGSKLAAVVPERWIRPALAATLAFSGLKLLS